jgi:PAS domain S-box-containing protein
MVTVGAGAPVVVENAVGGPVAPTADVWSELETRVLAATDSLMVADLAADAAVGTRQSAGSDGSGESGSADGNGGGGGSDGSSGGEGRGGRSLGGWVGAPLAVPELEARGVLSVVHPVAREWTAEELEVLESLARIAEGRLESAAALHSAERRVRSASARAERHQREILRLDRFQRLVETSLAGIFLVLDGEFLYVNPRFAELFGYPQEELMGGVRVLDLVAPEHRDRVRENTRRRLEGEVDSLRYTFRGLRRDGEAIELEVHGSRTDVGGRPALVGTIVDVTERARTESELRRQERRFRSLIDNSWDLIHVLDGAGSIRYVSPSVERLLGYRAERLLGTPLFDLVHSADRGTVARWLEETLASPGSSRCVEVRVRRRDGAWRVLETRARSAEWHDGERVAIANAHDVTERRRAEVALRQSEERHRLVVRATNSAIWDWDLRTGRVLWNGESSALLRYRQDEMQPSIAWWFERIHPQDRERVVTDLTSVIDGVGDDWSAEYRLRRGDDSYVHVLDCCLVLRDDRGGAVRVVGAKKDVTERHRSDAMQRFLGGAASLLDASLEYRVTAAALARRVVSTLADCCVIELADGRGGAECIAFAHVDATREPELRAGGSAISAGVVLTRGEPVLLGDTEASAADPDDPNRGLATQLCDAGFCSAISAPLLAGEETLGAITLATAEPSHRFTPLHLVTVTELARQLAQAVTQARLYEAAQQAVRARDEVLHMVSHDLRNPLNTIQLTAALLLDSAEERRAGNVERLGMIRRVAFQMNDMIQDLLDVSTMDAGGFSVRRRPRVLQELIDDARALLQPLADERHVGLVFTLEDGLPTLDIDDAGILRVLSNLIGNAIKFLPEGGRVETGVRPAGDAVEFTIGDNGPGIPPEQLPHVFDRFWQAREGDRRGSGLGLTIARGMIEAHGGEIRVDSRPGMGTTFRFTLPVAGRAG